MFGIPLLINLFISFLSLFFSLIELNNIHGKHPLNGTGVNVKHIK